MEVSRSGFSGPPQGSSVPALRAAQPPGEARALGESISVQSLTPCEPSEGSSQELEEELLVQQLLLDWHTEGEHDGTRSPPPPLDPAQRLYVSIREARSRFTQEEIHDKVESARAKHVQAVHPLHPEAQPLPSPREVVQIGEAKIRALSEMVRRQLDPGPGVQVGGGPGDVVNVNTPTLDRIGQVIYDAVTKYFHAGLKADNKAQLSEDGTTPIQTFRQILHLATTGPLWAGLPKNSNEFMLATVAYGYGNCSDQAYVCAALAQSLKSPHSVIRIKGPAFDHNLMVLTPNALDAAEIPSQRYRSIADFSPDWVVVDPWMKIVCSGDEYEGKVHDKLGKWERRGKVLLSHYDGTALAPRSEGVLQSISQGSLSLCDSGYLYPRDDERRSTD